MNAIMLHDKKEIERFLRKNTLLHIYGIGDLDDFYWPYTIWYALQKEKETQSIALLYTAAVIPVLVALCEARELSYLQDLMRSVIHVLPQRFFAHISPGAEQAILNEYAVTSRGIHYRMILKGKDFLKDADTYSAVSLSRDDLRELKELYAVSYPENWFDPRMLETNNYFGIKKDNRLISSAGVHVYSKKYRVAALGNITTHPDFRRKGFGSAVSARLCKSLLDTVDTIGLNVRIDNVAAINCYRKLGFNVIAEFCEYTVEGR